MNMNSSVLFFQVRLMNARVYKWLFNPWLNKQYSLCYICWILWRLCAMAWPFTFTIDFKCPLDYNIV
jgi:hypothetical protein